MAVSPFDTLKAAKLLKGAGFTEPHAVALVEVLGEATSGLVTKHYFHTEIQLLKTELQTELQLLKQRMTLRLGRMVFAAAGLIIVVIKFFP